MTTEDRKALFSSSPDRVGIDLVWIVHSGIETVYLCRNSEEIISRGQIHQPTGMQISLPEKGGENGTATLKISGVDRTYIELIQSLSPDAVIRINNAFVFADNPDDYIDGPYEFVVENVGIESATGTIELSLVVESPLDYYASRYRYDSEGFPGIWT